MSAAMPGYGRPVKMARGLRSHLLGLVLLLGVVAQIATAAPAMASTSVLYDQTDHGVPSTSIVSSSDSDLPELGAQVADDFTVPAGMHWAISEIDVAGDTNHGALETVPTKVDVFIYANAGTLPGTQLFGQTAIAATGGPNYLIPLSGVPVLDAGTYWISVEAEGSQHATWFWQTRSVQSGAPAAFQNPGGLRTPTCTTWRVRTTCASAAMEPDQIFKLLGSAQQVLRVSASGPGTGSVASSPAGIACQTTCSALFEVGATTTLTATPSPGATFTGWSGAGCSGTGVCSVSVTSGVDPVVVASFGVEPTLTVTTQDVGLVFGSVSSQPAGIACSASCTGQFAPGTVVTLTATPATGAIFRGWSGDCAGGATCQVTMDGDRAVGATFGAPPVTAFTTRAPKLDLRKGTAKLTVVVPGPGTLVLKGTGLVTRHVATTRAGQIVLTITPTASTRKRLARVGHVKVTARITYTPIGGQALTRARTLTLREHRSTKG